MGGVEASCWRGTAGEGGDTHHSAEEALRDGGRGGGKGGGKAIRGVRLRENTTRIYNDY